MNNERIATYVTGLTYPKPKQQCVERPVAFYLKLLKEKISSSQRMISDSVPQNTFEPLPSYHKNLNHSPHSYHKESLQEPKSPQGFS